MSDLQQFEAYSAADIICWAISTYGARFAIATSFQKEGMVLLDLASKTGRAFRVFTLETGRLPEETHQMISTVSSHYGITVELVHPDPLEVERMVASHGLNLFYDRQELRKLCCEVRKVRPLERKLLDLEAWATGLRRSQSETRADTPKVATVEGRVKINPLADWTREQVDAYILEKGVPVHPLYSRGYTSIGCDPCTRAVAPGEEERAGRWWWEENAKKECGIHFSPDGRITRVKS